MSCDLYIFLQGQLKSKERKRLKMETVQLVRSRQSLQLICLHRNFLYHRFQSIPQDTFNIFLNRNTAQLCILYTHLLLVRIQDMLHHSLCKLTRFKELIKDKLKSIKNCKDTYFLYMKYMLTLILNILYSSRHKHYNFDLQQ